MSEDVVLFETNVNGVATITLNRPKAINSISQKMIEVLHQQLQDWVDDTNVKIIILKGNGPKGFCAGGDIKTLYTAKNNKERFNQAMDFFELEYKTDYLIHQYPKPIVAILDGIVMGGGVGLSYGASHRIVTERTKWAMPEMNIGFFPDVGAAYFLNQAPGKTGYYLALTASTISGTDAIYIKAADYYMESKNIEAFINYVKQSNWHQIENVKHALQLSIQEYKKPISKNKLQNQQEQIDRHFSLSTMEEIIQSLESDTSDFASQTMKTILAKSPISLKVTLEQLKRGKGKSIQDCLDTDRKIAKNFMTSNDFYEGVRSVVIDKDHQPHYVYKNLSDVNDRLVESYFY